MAGNLWKVPVFVLAAGLVFTLPDLTSATIDVPEDPGLNVSFLLNNFQIGYDRRVRPNYGGIPVTVGVSLYILSIGDLSEKFMDFTFDMYFRQYWSDPRLSFDKSNFGISKLVVGAEYIKLIWVPDTFFVNEKIALFHQATTENQFLRYNSFNTSTKLHARYPLLPLHLIHLPKVLIVLLHTHCPWPQWLSVQCQCSVSYKI